ncbi:hypothetical protein FRC01_004891 [Tulasnella sp. 417]|nr:hypothetical protein FRC01_004891 [Tulasnella sp. 417]
MNPRTKLAFFGDDDDDLSLLQAQSKPIDDQKAKTYTQGLLRKSKREKEKEAEVAKREEEEREAAKAYAEFLDAFDAPSTSSGGSKSKTLGFVKASDATGKAQAYEPAAQRSKDGIPTGPRVRNREPSPPPASATSKPKGKRAMDMFLEELKRCGTEIADLQNELDTTARPPVPVPARGLTPLLANRVSTVAVILAQGPERIPQDRGLVPETVAAGRIALDRGQITGLGAEVARVLVTDETAVIIMSPLVAGDTVAPVLTPDPAPPRFNAAGRQSMRKVVKNGSKFGDMLRHKERDNPKFSFLYDKRLPEYHLFRSIAERDYKCPYADIPFNDDGGVSPYSTDSGEDSEKERARKGSLGRLAQKRFENMLRTLSGRKGEIAACMVFSLEHADAVTEVVDIIISSLLVDSTPVPRKIARLHVICDILHNSAATIPNAWKFRQEFQARLPAVFDHLSEIYQSFPGRITADTFKKQVLTIVEVWEDWIIFPPDFTTDMRNRLDGVKQDGQEGPVPMDDSTNEEPSNASAGPSATAPSKFRTSAFKPAELQLVEDDEDMDIDDSDADLEGDAIPLDGEELDV